MFISVLIDNTVHTHYTDKAVDVDINYCEHYTKQINTTYVNFVTLRRVVRIYI